MHYQRYFDKIIDECFGPEEDITSPKVKELFIDRHGSRNTPHPNKIALMLKLHHSLDEVRRTGKLVYWRKRA